MVPHAPSAVIGDIGFCSQFMKPHMATIPKATITRMDRIVLTIPTSLTPLMLIHVNIRIIATLKAISAPQLSSNQLARYPPARIT